MLAGARRASIEVVTADGARWIHELVEAVNNKIKLTVRMAYGFRNIDNLIALVMLRRPNLPVALPGRTS